MGQSLAFAAFAALALCACSDDDPGPPTDGGADAALTDADATPGDLCANDADRAALEAMYGELTMQDIAANCGVECVGKPPAQQSGCVTECVHRDTEMRLSLACSSCVTLTVGCSRDHCFRLCAPIAGADPNSAECLACQCGMNATGTSCRAVLSMCGGIDGEKNCSVDAGT